MKRSYYLLLPVLWLMLVCTQRAHARWVDWKASVDRSATPEMGYIPTPQTWAFMRYSGAETSALWGGTTRTDIPIYTYQDEDFTIPISLGYATNGMLPSMQSGIVGLGWFLDAGGMVAREINRVPDEYYDDVGADTIPEEKLYPWGSLEAPVMSLEDRLTMLGVPGGGPYNYFKNYDTETDEFRFKFMGRSGSFNLDNFFNKYPRANACKDYGNYTIWAYIDKQKGDNNEIKIVTEDGYEYIFGGEEKYVERSLDGEYVKMPDNAYRFIYDAKHSPVVTWYLKKIVAPNGRVATFEYTDGEILLSDGQHIYNPTQTNLVVAFTQGQNLPEAGIYKWPNIVKTTYLSRITISDKADIVFTYSSKEAAEISPGAMTCYKSTVGKLRKLDKIEVLSKMAPAGSSPVFSCNLGYKTVDRRLLLDRVRIPGKGEYKLDYFLDKPLPDVASNAVDFWGFYNGHVGTDRDYLGVTADNEMNEIISGDTKLPHAEFSIAGCLRSITYPMGGQRSFEYEANMAQTGIFRRSTAPEHHPKEHAYNALPYPYSVMFLTPECGGVRLKKLTDDDKKGAVAVKQYDYRDGDGKIAGIMINIPRFIVNKYTVGSREDIPAMGVQLARHTFAQPHIEYETVLETSSDGSKKRYLFTSYGNCPDDYEEQHSVSVSAQESPALQAPSNTFWNAAFERNITRPANSNQAERGKVILEISYDQSGKIVKRKVNNYQYTSDTDKFLVGYTASYGTLWSHKVNIETRMLSGITEICYFGKDSLTTIENYAYANMYNSDGNGLLCSIGRYDTDGAGRSKMINYERKIDMDNRFPDITVPVKILDVLEPARSTVNVPIYILNAQEFRYTQTANAGFQVASICRSTFTSPVAKNTYDIFSTDVGEMKTAKEFLWYNNDFRPVEIYEESEVPTCRIWGYRGLYVVAEVRNAALSTLMAIPGLEDIGSVPLEGGLTAAQEDALRSIPNAEVVTCKYVPLIGKSEETDAAGRKHTYEYDTYGRLVRERDHEGNLLKEYTYSIQ